MIQYTNKSDGFGGNQHRDVQGVQSMYWVTWEHVGGEKGEEENCEVTVSWRLREESMTEGDSDQ